MDRPVVFEEASDLGEVGVSEGEVGAAFGVELRKFAIDRRRVIGDPGTDAGSLNGDRVESAPRVLGGEFGEDLFAVSRSSG